jgi:hypothetical protein
MKHKLCGYCKGRKCTIGKNGFQHDCKWCDSTGLKDKQMILKIKKEHKKLVYWRPKEVIVL